jgi:hypothetical protein
MVRGSLLIHGPPVISGAGSPTRAVKASGPGDAARNTTVDASAAAATHVPNHVHDVFMATSLPPSWRSGVTPLSILRSGARGRPGLEVGYLLVTPYNDDGERVGMGPPGTTGAITQYPNRKGNG